MVYYRVVEDGGQCIVMQPLRVAVHYRPWVAFHRHAATLKSLNALEIIPVTGEAAMVMPNEAFDSSVTDSSLFR